MNISRSAADPGPALAAEVAAERRKPCTNTLIQIALGRPLGFLESLLENVSHLGLHRVAVLRSADAQTLLERRIDIADRQRGHRDLIQLHAVIIHKAIVECNACATCSTAGLLLKTDFIEMLMCPRRTGGYNELLGWAPHNAHKPLSSGCIK
jgi:hypothetical protein